MASMAMCLKWTVVLLLLGAATTSAYNDADFQMRAHMRALKQFGGFTLIHSLNVSCLGLMPS